MKVIQTSKILFYIVIVMHCAQSCAISQKAIYATTGLTAVASGVASYLAIPLFKTEMHPAVFGAASVLGTSSVYCCLSYFTPEYRLKKAHALLKQLSKRSLIHYAFAQDKTFFDAIHSIYLTHDLPLISAYNHLVFSLPTVQEAFTLIRKAAAEAGKDKKLKVRCKLALAQAKNVLKYISYAIKRIRDHRDYLPQLRIYKEFLVK